jgi:BirA family transcriptional regulator, biotin operon repressor / biotin---[acetyl-CoA-carboxylase] ligase
VADSLAPEAVTPLLRGRFGRPYHYAERTTSTQKMIRADDPEGAVGVAEGQTEGRGRLGRKWLAPAFSSVHVSILLLPAVEPSRLPELSLVAGRAVADAIASETRLGPSIKFPNDVLIDGKKVAGILAESSEGRVVLGIGVNVNQTAEQLPAKTETPPTSLRIETGSEIARAPLLAAILERLETEYDGWLGALPATGRRVDRSVQTDARQSHAS